MTTGLGTERGAPMARWLLVATTALALAALAGGCGADRGQPTSGVPSTGTVPPAPGRPARVVYHAQTASFTDPDMWAQARRQAQQLRAKGFPATISTSHELFPSRTLYLFVAVASGEFPTRDQAQAQVDRLRQAGFADAKVLEIPLPR